MMKLSFATLLLVTLVLTCFFIPATIAGSDFCDSKCNVRCSKAGRQDRCLKYCGICCEECHCVPSGTYGHKDECPCYRDKKNSKGGPKCP
ncbi:peamaclein [Solanum tuberosum]|uniref:peamaclein n=1 Tax=Solanum tuberosum TaxID=4113 RepID=UPI00073A4A21|nr:PREDICTED: peamaclein [Solanum tuberosum]